MQLGRHDLAEFVRLLVAVRDPRRMYTKYGLCQDVWESDYMMIIIFEVLKESGLCQGVWGSDYMMSMSLHTQIHECIMFTFQLINT